MEKRDRARLGKYELLKTLGKGGYSKVKLAKDTSTGLQYAIKLINKVNHRIDR